MQILTIVPYKVFPAHMGGQKGIALFYEHLAKFTKVNMVATKNNDTPNFENINFIPALTSTKLKFLNPFYFFLLKNIIRQKVEQPVAQLFDSH